MFPHSLEIYLDRNKIRLWWHLIRVLIRARSRPPYILAGIWFYLFYFGKWWVLKQMDCAFWCEISLLSASFTFSRKCNAVCWRDIIIPRQRDTGYGMILFYQYWCFESNFISIATLKMIHFAFFAANVFSIRISRKQYKLERCNLL